MFLEQNLNVWCNKKLKLLGLSKYFCCMQLQNKSAAQLCTSTSKSCAFNNFILIKQITILLIQRFLSCSFSFNKTFIKFIFTKNLSLALIKGFFYQNNLNLAHTKLFFKSTNKSFFLQNYTYLLYLKYFT